jgi:NTP pyrophosphatase (non-canonical NTP hydrolase)
MNNAEYVAKSARTDLDDYSKMAERCQDETTLKILHAVMGMVTEAGELMDAVKRHLIYGKPFDFVNLKEENGDSFWYQALLARASGFTFEESMSTNVDKLLKRFPEKFSEERALNRDIEAERKTLLGEKCVMCGMGEHAAEHSNGPDGDHSFRPESVLNG